MSLFFNSDIPTYEPEELSKRVLSADIAHYGFSCLSDADVKNMTESLGYISVNKCIYIMSDGVWSNIQLIEFLLKTIGSANLYFTTWSISAESITAMQSWADSGLIKSLYAIIDQGIRNRKPELYQQAVAAFPFLKLCKCHAKVTVLENESYQVTIIGSANMTRNPRKEAGVIINDKSLADANIKWILEEFANE